MASSSFKRGEFIPGTQYQFVREIGVGGQGVAVLAHHSFLDTEVVIKLLHADQSQHAHLQERMRDEAKALARINHPNIVHVIDGGVTAENPPRPFFVMERLHGDTLYALFRRKGSSFPVRTALTTAIELLEGLDVAHNPPHSMIHRDIKPGNIFMSRVTPHETRAVLLDFGVARMMERVNARTQQKFLGTWEYAAPEQLEGHATPRTDIYAVGLLLYELIAGHHPFSYCKTREQYAQANMFDTPKRLSTLGEINGAIDAIVASALAKDQNQRPRSAHDFAEALKSIRHALDIEHDAKRPPVSQQANTEEEPFEKMWARMGIAQKDTVTTELHAPSSPLSGSQPSSQPPIRGKHFGDVEAPRTAPMIKPRIETPERSPPPSAADDPFALARETHRRVDNVYANASPRPAAGMTPSRARRPSRFRNAMRRFFTDKPLVAMVAAGASVVLLCVAVYAKLFREPRPTTTKPDPSAIASVAAPALIAPVASVLPPPVPDSVQLSTASATVALATTPKATTTADPLTRVIARPSDRGPSNDGSRTTPQPTATTKLKRPGAGLDDPAPSASHAAPHMDLLEHVF